MCVLISMMLCCVVYFPFFTSLESDSTHLAMIIDINYMWKLLVYARIAEILTSTNNEMRVDDVQCEMSFTRVMCRLALHAASHVDTSWYSYDVVVICDNICHLQDPCLIAALLFVAFCIVRASHWITFASYCFFFWWIMSMCMKNIIICEKFTFFRLYFSSMLIQPSSFFRRLAQHARLGPTT